MTYVRKHQVFFFSKNGVYMREDQISLSRHNQQSEKDVSVRDNSAGEEIHTNSRS